MESRPTIKKFCSAIPIQNTLYGSLDQDLSLKIQDILVHHES